MLAPDETFSCAIGNLLWTQYIALQLSEQARPACISLLYWFYDLPLTRYSKNDAEASDHGHFYLEVNDKPLTLYEE